MEREQFESLIKEKVDKVIMSYLDSLFGAKEITRTIETKPSVVWNEMTVANDEKLTEKAKQIQAEIDKARKEASLNPQVVFDGDPASYLPLFCVGCGIRFEPNDMVDISHVIETDGTEYNEYHHDRECIIIDDPIKVKSRNLIATKKASEIVDDLDNHRELRERETEKVKLLRADQQMARTRINNLLNIIKKSDKPLRTYEIFKMQSDYKSDASICQILNQKVKDGILKKIDGKYSYNGGDNGDI
jgi:hypothetical protein